MASHLTRGLNQTGTYWASPVSDGFGGFSFTDPVTVICRYEEKVELFIDIQGQEKRSVAVVYVAQDMIVGEYFALGTHTDSADNEPKDVDVAYMIQAFKKIPNIKGTSWLRKIWL